MNTLKCCHCGAEKDAILDFTPCRRNGKHYCRDCEGEQRKRYVEFNKTEIGRKLREDKLKWSNYLKDNPLETKECSECKEVKLLKEFNFRNSFCKKCSHKRSYLSYKKSLTQEERNRRTREYRRKYPEKLMILAARKRAKRDNLPFNIDTSDIKIPKICPVLGINVYQSDEKQTKNSPVLDKIIPKLGYVKGNVMVISNEANLLKSYMGIDQLEKLIIYIKKYGSMVEDYSI